MKTIVTTSIFKEDKCISHTAQTFYTLNLSKKFAEEKSKIYEKENFKRVKLNKYYLKRRYKKNNIEIVIGIMNYNYGKNKKELWIKF